MATKSIYSMTHELQLRNCINIKLKRRRCFTEICRKVDGEDKKKERINEPSGLGFLPNPYTSTCFELFITGDSPRES